MYAWGSSAVTLGNAQLGGDLWAERNSTVGLIGGTVGGDVEVYGSPTVTMSSGSAGGLRANESPAVTLDNGMS